MTTSIINEDMMMMMMS